MVLGSDELFGPGEGEAFLDIVWEDWGLGDELEVRRRFVGSVRLGERSHGQQRFLGPAAIVLTLRYPQGFSYFFVLR